MLLFKWCGFKSNDCCGGGVIDEDEPRLFKLDWDDEETDEDDAPLALLAPLLFVSVDDVVLDDKGTRVFAERFVADVDDDEDDDDDEVVEDDAPIWPLGESKSFFKDWLFNVFGKDLLVVSSFNLVLFWLELLCFTVVLFVQFVILLSWFSWLFKFEFTEEVEPCIIFKEKIREN